MKTSDIVEFGMVLGDVFDLYGRELTERQVEFWFRLLKAHSVQVIRAALDAHIKDQSRGRYYPMPADVLAQIDRVQDWSKGAV